MYIYLERIIQKYHNAKQYTVIDIKNISRNNNTKSSQFLPNSRLDIYKSKHD